jgi:PAS domain S-box-containing protein
VEAPEPTAAGETAETAETAETMAASFAAMARNVPGALFRYVQWPDGRNAVQYMSPRCLDLWEIAPEDIVADAGRLWAMVDPQDLPGMAASVQHSAQTLEPWYWQWRITTPSGRRKWLEGRGHPQRQDDGSVLWNSVILDVTEQRLAQEALRVKDAALESSLNGIALATLDGELTYVNPAFCAMWATTPAQALGRHATEFWHARRHPEAVIEALQSVGHWTGEMQATRGDGQTFDVEVSASLVRRPNGQPLCMMGSFVDVTERNRAQAELQALNAELESRVRERTAAMARAMEDAERANRAKSEFLSHMSHELRTPMNAVLGFAQLLEHDPALGGRQRDHVREILRGGRHLLSLINDLLDLARVEAGQLPMSLEPVALGPVADEALTLLAPLAAMRAIRLPPVPSPLQGVVQADRTRLMQVLVNLLSNAIKYNRPGGVVTLTERIEGGRVCVTVGDDGPGIAAERLPQLFEPFQRLGADPGVEGTGIGLVIARRMVELMHGGIRVDSRPGDGTRFTVALQQAAPVVSAVDTAAKASGASQPSAGRHRVLYIDDNPANVKLMREMLDGWAGIELQAAHMGGLGLELARTQPPDLVMLDLQLPDMDGYAVLSALQADAPLARLPVIAVTSLGTERDIARGRAAGFVDYLVKPVDLSALRAAVGRALALQAMP